MNRVFIEVEVPESVWMRGECDTNEDGGMRYEAKFCRAGSSLKSTHMGPVVSLVVYDDNGKEIGRRSSTIGVKTNGELYFQSYVEASSDVETCGLLGD